MTPGEFNELHARYRRALESARHSSDLRVLVHLRFLEQNRGLSFDPWTAYLSHAVNTLAVDLSSADLLGIDSFDPFAHWLHMARGKARAPDVTSDEWSGALDAAERRLDGIAAARNRGDGQRSSHTTPDEDGVCSITIPVESATDASVEEPFKGIRTVELLRVDVSVSWRLGGRNGHVARVTGKVDNLVRERAERALPHVGGIGDWTRRWGMPPLDLCVFDCAPGPRDVWITGASAVLGIVLAATVARASLAPAWSIPRLLPDVAATADLDGPVVVGVDLVREKVRVAARGGLAALVVAQEQERDAALALDELRRTEGPYPLRIVPIGSLSELPGFGHEEQS